jgi:hypothetical protein
MESNQISARLDAADIVFFRRQLESIDQRVYSHKYPKYKARMLVPTQQGVDPNARVYTYRMYDQQGKARPIGNASDDAPRSNASGEEVSQRIQQMANSYEYDIWEIQAAAKSGVPLDEMRALGCRRGMEELTDEYLSLGNTNLKLTGLLNISGTSTGTSAGAWGTLSSADPDAILADLNTLANTGVEATDEAFNKFVLCMPLPKYNLAANLKLNNVSGETVLSFFKKTNTYVEDVVPWYRTEKNQGGDSTHDRLIAFPRDVECVAALVPQELQFLTPEQRNFSYVINAHASCGGVVCRFPKAITYMDVSNP